MTTAARKLTFALLAAFAAVCLCLAVAPQQAQAANDVDVVVEDHYVYCGGIYDFEVELNGATAASYEWHSKMKLDHASDPDCSIADIHDPEDWLYDTDTAHLRLNTNTFTDGSDDDDWGQVLFYCVVTDTKGKKHYSKNLNMHIGSTQQFRNRFDRDGGWDLSFKNVQPAFGSDSSVTVINMNVGDVKRFGFNTNFSYPYWMAESDPFQHNSIDVIAADGTLRKHVDQAWYDFQAPRAGTYLLAMSSEVLLGDERYPQYATNPFKGQHEQHSIAHYYRIEVTEPGQTPAPVVDPTADDPAGGQAVGDIYVSEITGVAPTIEEPWPRDAARDYVPVAGMQIPAVSISPESSSQYTSAAIEWEQYTLNGWEPCKDSTFKEGECYRLSATFWAKDGYYFKSYLRGKGYTDLITSIEYQGEWISSGHGSSGSRGTLTGTNYYPQNSIGTEYASYTLRMFTVPTDNPTADDMAKDMHPEKGWRHDAYGWQYYKPDTGTLATGEWVGIGGKWYYFGSDTYMAKGWTKVGGKWYYLAPAKIPPDTPEGAMLTGWQKLSGKWYYLDPKKGDMKTGFQTIGSKTYYFDSSGAMLTGWQKIDGKWYFFQSSGAMVTGWLKDGGKYYLLGSDGVMLTGWQKVSGSWYYLDSKGVMQTSWQKLSGSWYYFGTNGKMVTDWQKIDGKWYYFFSSGKMATGTQVINGKTYTFSSSGVWIS